jgi:hypothetical protein
MSPLGFEPRRAGRLPPCRAVWRVEASADILWADIGIDCEIGGVYQREHP